jgi:hypothetical protein
MLFDPWGKQYKLRLIAGRDGVRSPEVYTTDSNGGTISSIKANNSDFAASKR